MRSLYKTMISPKSLKLISSVLKKSESFLDTIVVIFFRSLVTKSMLFSKYMSKFWFFNFVRSLNLRSLTNKIFFKFSSKNEVPFLSATNRVLFLISAIFSNLYFISHSLVSMALLSKSISPLLSSFTQQLLMLGDITFISFIPRE